ncbi:hypothetical protein FHW79_003889 [Azospirillum sp. OGB3]|uniref:hypothetical protein n=1 Tax=Azospirillum sp. OGB3 TaxID=2587012 RepID=UPI001606F10A|nr:hypothetical protein [Azospirillum sp. OGB3]MBB3266251.1 hypothetical protein [Azospirillum sp. OGB3]
MKRRATLPTVTATAVGILCGALLAAVTVPHPASAQGRPVLTNVIPESAAVTLHAKITGIDADKRKVTLGGRSGTPVTVMAGPAVRLEMLKVGDTVDAQFYRSVAFMVSQPGTPVPEDEVQQAVARPVEAPGGIGVQVTRLSGLVVGIDLGANSIDLVNPNGGEVYTVNVTDPARQARLPSLKVGDTITAVVSEALAVSIEPARKSWF